MRSFDYFKVGNIHGNEVVGRQLLLQTISHLITKDITDKRVNRLLNTTDIYFLPSMNPDGFVKAQVSLTSCQFRLPVRFSALLTMTHANHNATFTFY